MRRDLYYKKEVRREFENFGNLCCRALWPHLQASASSSRQACIVRNVGFSQPCIEWYLRANEKKIR